MQKSLVLGSVLLVAAQLGCSEGRLAETENSQLAQSTAALGVSVAPSKSPPGGLTPAQTPQFVALGFDDNAYVDSINWIRDFLRNHRNPAGSGNAGTFDGAKLSATFFITAQYGTSDGVLNVNGQTTASVIAAWRSLYDAGLEVGNHTYSHTGNNTLDQFTRCNDVLANQVGVPRSEIHGFRFPFLYYTAAQYQTMVSAGFHYDSSVEQPWGSTTPGQDYWPWTMDHTPPYAPIPVGQFPGFWELPLYSALIAGTNKFQTMFDFNLWATADVSKQQFVDTLKNLLNARLAGNRAPVLFGAHTDEYSQFNTGFESNAAGANWQQRRQAIEEFLLYAISKPDVRVVAYNDVRKWMENPIRLGSCTPTTCAAQSKNCGQLADGCGGTLNCGSCTAPQVCGGGGVANVCGGSCTPESNAAFCSRVGKNCGSVTANDNCGTPRTVASCGSCTSPQTCGGGGVANVCGSGASACAVAYSKANCPTYTTGKKVSRNGRNYTCANGNCANCGGTASCEPGATGCPWGAVWTDNGPCL